MSEHERRTYDVLTDAPVLEVVDVGAAHADRADPDQHLFLPRIGDSSLLKCKVADPAQDGRAHGGHFVTSRGRTCSLRPALPGRLRTGSGWWWGGNGGWSLTSGRTAPWPSAPTALRSLAATPLLPPWS